MKATLDENGTLTVLAENNLEAYALDRWADDYFGNHKSVVRPAKLMVQPTVGGGQAKIPGLPAPDMSKPCRREIIESGAVAIPKSCPRCGLSPTCTPTPKN